MTDVFHTLAASSLDAAAPILPLIGPRYGKPPAIAGDPPEVALALAALFDADIEAAAPLMPLVPSGAWHAEALPTFRQLERAALADAETSAADDPAPAAAEPIFADQYSSNAAGQPLDHTETGWDRERGPEAAVPHDPAGRAAPSELHSGPPAPPPPAAQVPAGAAASTALLVERSPISVPIQLAAAEAATQDRSQGSLVASPDSMPGRADGLAARPPVVPNPADLGAPLANWPEDRPAARPRSSAEPAVSGPAGDDARPPNHAAPPALPPVARTHALVERAGGQTEPGIFQPPDSHAPPYPRAADRLHAAAGRRGAYAQPAAPAPPQAISPMPSAHGELEAHDDRAQPRQFAREAGELPLGTTDRAVARPRAPESSVLAEQPMHLLPPDYPPVSGSYAASEENRAVRGIPSDPEAGARLTKSAVAPALVEPLTAAPPDQQAPIDGRDEVAPPPMLASHTAAGNRAGFAPDPRSEALGVRTEGDRSGALADQWPGSADTPAITSQAPTDRVRPQRVTLATTETPSEIGAAGSAELRLTALRTAPDALDAPSAPARDWPAGAPTSQLLEQPADGTFAPLAAPWTGARQSANPLAGTAMPAEMESELAGSAVSSSASQISVPGRPQPNQVRLGDTALPAPTAAGSTSAGPPAQDGAPTRLPIEPEERALPAGAPVARAPIVAPARREMRATPPVEPGATAQAATPAGRLSDALPASGRAHVMPALVAGSAAPQERDAFENRAPQIVPAAPNPERRPGERMDGADPTRAGSLAGNAGSDAPAIDKASGAPGLLPALVAANAPPEDRARATVPAGTPSQPSIAPAASSDLSAERKPGSSGVGNLAPPLRGLLLEAEAPARAQPDSSNSQSRAMSPYRRAPQPSGAAALAASVLPAQPSPGAAGARPDEIGEIGHVRFTGSGQPPAEPSPANPAADRISSTGGADNRRSGLGTKPPGATGFIQRAPAPIGRLEHRTVPAPSPLVPLIQPAPAPAVAASMAAAARGRLSPAQQAPARPLAPDSSASARPPRSDSESPALARPAADAGQGAGVGSAGSGARLGSENNDRPVSARSEGTPANGLRDRVAGRRDLPAPAAAPAIRVTIGRVEVRSTPTAAAPSRRREQPRQGVSLDEYLRSQRGGRR